MRATDRAALTYALIGTGVGVVLGATITWLVMRGERVCRLDAAQLASLTPAPLPVASPAPAPPPPPPPVVEADAPPPPTPVEPHWRVDVAKVWQWTDKPGFGIRVDLAMTRLVDADVPATEPLRAKTTCQVDGVPIVELTTFGPPAGQVLKGERAIGALIDPFYWQRLETVPTRCELRFFDRGVTIGVFCATLGAVPVPVVAEACPPMVEAE